VPLKSKTKEIKKGEPERKASGKIHSKRTPRRNKETRIPAKKAGILKKGVRVRGLTSRPDIRE